MSTQTDKQKRIEQELINSEFIDTDTAAALTGGMVSRSSLERYRTNGDPEGPPFYKFRQKVRYKRSEILHWVNATQRNAPSNS